MNCFNATSIWKAVNGGYQILFFTIILFKAENQNFLYFQKV